MTQECVVIIEWYWHKNYNNIIIENVQKLKEKTYIVKQRAMYKSQTRDTGETCARALNTY